jgi:hypothetical protein
MSFELDLIQLLQNGGPAAAVLGVGLVVVKKDLAYLKVRMHEMLSTHERCKLESAESNKELHGRVTCVQERVATLEGHCKARELEAQDRERARR